MIIIKRIAYRLYLQSRINFFWTFWYLRNYKTIRHLGKILEVWNRKIPYFFYKFPNLNAKTFIINYKYWIHWISKMDPREKLVFNAYNPYILVNDEEWLHLDLSKKEVPITYYSFYFPDLQWIPIEIFKSIEQLQVYISISEATSDTLIEYINTTIQTERHSAFLKRKSEGHDSGHRSLIIEGGGIRLAPG